MIRKTTEPSAAAERAVTSFDAGRLIVATVLLLLAVSLVPIFSVKLPPLNDYPNHLARIYLIAELARQPLLQQFYALVWHPIPDLAMDLLLPGLVPLLGIFLAGKLFVALVPVLLVTGAVALHLALHRRLSLGPVLVFPFLYNQAFLFGLLNYLFGIGVAIWALAAWVRLRDGSPLRRGVVSAGFVLVLYFAHLYALGLYGLTLLCLEAGRLRRLGLPSTRVRRADLAAFALPFLPAVVLLGLSPTGGEVLEFHYTLDFAAKLVAGVYVLLIAYRPPLDLACAAALTVLVIWALLRRRLVLPSGAGIFLGAGMLVWLAMPSGLFNSHFADARLPIALVLMLAGMLRWQLGRRETLFLCAVVAGLTLLRTAAVEEVWHASAKDAAEIEQSLAQIVPGSRILTAQSGNRIGADTMTRRMIHLPELAIIKRASLVTLEFTNPSGQNLRLQPAYRDSAPPFGDPPLIVAVVAEHPGPGPAPYWEGWRRKYDYVYVLESPAGTPSPSPALALVYEGAHFQLFRVTAVAEHPAGR